MRDAQAIANLSAGAVFTEVLNLLCEIKDTGLKDVLQRYMGGDGKQPIGFKSGSQQPFSWQNIFPGPLPQLRKNEYRNSYDEYRNDGQEYHEPSKMRRGMPGTERGRRGYRSDYDNVNMDEMLAEIMETARDEARRTARQEMEYRSNGNEYEQEYEADGGMEAARRLPKRSRRTGRFVRGEAKTTPSNDMRSDNPRMEMETEAEVVNDAARRAEAKKIEQERIANENYLRGVNEARAALEITRTENEAKRGILGTGVNVGMR